MTPEQALNIVGQQIVNRIPDELRANGSYITGNLAKSYTYEVVQTKNGWTLNIIDGSGRGGYNYGDSVDEGLEDLVRQTSPPQDEQKPSLDRFLRCLLSLNSAHGFQIKVSRRSVACRRMPRGAKQESNRSTGIKPDERSCS
jgi:hypothetical protein